ncbi:class I SAM-dependent methyltransferase [Thiohalobacter sp. IOR34]|uniref:class I SAM-dependent methyltransferase n=1 Tax=Thiohalobacter sp. IOR34 TaxID=3057176 RepID=UPI0025B03652|nr:class I SAM-dependent methyltransferase [Thiohalobacter sp. IOR34]WJW75392.1 class I SAM-dependent methyltransferase [Thiohalobacter sp. IOR34]
MSASRPCPLCEHPHPRLIHDQPQARFFPRRIHRCPGCGFAFVDPLPDAATLSRVYNDSNYFHDPGQAFSETPPRPGVVRRAASRARWLQRQGVSGRLLDVGCAEGVFLDQARQAGLEPVGVELSRYAADVARRRTGCEVHTEPLAALIERDLSFDALGLWDVLEHVTDPFAFLGECRALLRPGGWIALSTPNQRSYNGVLRGDDWKGYRDGPEHLYFYNARTLSRLLERCGFQVQARRSRNIAPVLMRWAVVLGWGGDLEILARRRY